MKERVIRASTGYVYGQLEISFCDFSEIAHIGVKQLKIIMLWVGIGVAFVQSRIRASLSKAKLKDRNEFMTRGNVRQKMNQ